MEDASSENGIPLKIAVLGQTLVGKSALTFRFINDKFPNEHDTTIEDSYSFTAKIDDINCQLEILDTAGQDDYQTMLDTWINSSDGFVLVYSIDNKDSFESTKKRYERILKLKGDQKVAIVVAGNKCDLEESRKVSREEAENTSLGADDGMGIAIILYLAKNHKNFSHGRIRIIFTTDEEQGMSGAMNISDKFFKDAKFMINCDSENFDEIVVGSAGNVRVEFTKKINFVEPAEDLQNAFRINISGLRGGHSGLDIDSHRASAIKVMRNFLRLVKGRGRLQVAKASGGVAINAIPSTSEAVIVTNTDMENLHECAEMLKFQIKNKYDKGEPDFKITFENVERPAKVFSTKDFSEFTNLITIVHSGVYAKNDSMIETSANIGIVRTEGDVLQVSLLARSNITDMLSDFVTMYEQAGAMTNFEVKCDSPSPVWESNPASFLSRIITKIFKDQNNFAAKVHTIHAGLECGYFSAKNKNLDIVSIGTTNENIHSPQERLHLKTVAPEVNLIRSTLEKISELED